MYAMRALEQNPYIIESLSCVLSILRMIDFRSLILLNIFCRMYLILKESKNTALFLSINKES